MLTQYTSPDEVRSKLGVGPKELRDADIELEGREQELVEDLESININLPANYAALSGSLSANQLRFQRRVQLFAAYSVARALLTSLAIFAPQRITDGRAETQRIADPYAATRVGVEAMYALLRARLIEAYAALFPLEALPASTTLTVVASTGLALDPVTGT